MPASYPTTVWDGDSLNRDSDNGDRKAPDWRDWNRMVQEVAATQTKADGIEGGVDSAANDTIGALLSATGLTVVEKGDGAVHKTVISLVEVDMPTVDGTTPATDGHWGTLKLYTFPAGHINILGSHALFPLAGLEATTGAGTGLSDTADFEIGVGSAASANATAFGLENGTQEDIVTALDVDLTSGTSDAAESAASGTAATYDGSTTPSTLNLNMRTLDDADAGTVADILKVTGTVTILWSNLGDD